MHVLISITSSEFVLLELTGGAASRYLHNSPMYKKVVALCFLQMFQKLEAENFLQSTKVAPEKDKKYKMSNDEPLLRNWSQPE